MPAPGPILFLLLLASSLAAAPSSPGAEPVSGSLTSSWTVPADTSAWVNELRDRVRHDRRDVVSRRQLAAILGRSGDIELRREAARALQEALQVDDGDPDIWAEMARLQERRGFRREAKIAFEKALDIDPDRPDLWSDLAQHELRRFMRSQRDEFLESSQEANHRSLSGDPGNPDALRRAIRIAYFEGNRAALDSLSLRWLAVDPDNPWPSLVRGMIYTEAGAFDRAEDAFRAGLLLLPASDAEAFKRLDFFDEKAEEERVSRPDSTEFLEDYWRWRDPTPADPVNPRLLEHYRRLVQAELLFGLDHLNLRGWDHAPGRMLVRYGLPSNFAYQRDVWRGGDARGSGGFGSPTLGVNYGNAESPRTFYFVDYNLSGRFFDPVSGVPTSADFAVAMTPSAYTPPFVAPALEEEVELWRFVDSDGEGRIEVAVALPADAWPDDVLAEPYRISSKLSLYDQDWRVEDASIWSWALFRMDRLRRLVGLFTVQGTPDSAIVGMETIDRLNRGRSGGYATLPPLDAGDGKPFLSDIAFLRGVDFDATRGGRYRRGDDGSGIPNPGHRYQVGEPIGIGFEAYRLTPDGEGYHRARIRVTVGRQTRKGWLSVLLSVGQDQPEAEISFTSTDPGKTLEQLLSVDLPPLHPGDYSLRIEVEDLVAGDSAERSAPFTVLEPGKLR